MTSINKLRPIQHQNVADFGTALLKTSVAMVALGALAGLAYCLYQLYQKHLVLSDRAQLIRNSFTATQDLNEWELIQLAKKVEALEQKVRAQPHNFPLTRFQIKMGIISTKFIVTIQPNHGVRVQRIERALGRGGCGKVIQLRDLRNGEQTALKIATPPKRWVHDPKYRQACEEDLQKEHRNLMRIYEPSAQRPRNVQDQPLSNVITLLKFNRYGNKKRLAYEGTLYEGNLNNLIFHRLPIKTRLHIAIHVLLGMETFQARKMVCHDLKPENILYRRGRDSSLYVHLSDLGGVTHESELGKALEKNSVGYTPGYADTTQLAVAHSIPLGFVQRPCVRTSEKCSLGLTLFSILTGYQVTTGTSEERLKTLWQRAQLPLQGEYGELFSALQAYSSTGILAGFFKKDVKEIRKLIEKLCNNS